MKVPITINEARQPYSSGDVSFYDAVHDACLDMEPIDVREGIYFAFDADGVQLDIQTDGRKIWLVPTSVVDKPKLINLIKETLERVETARGKDWIRSYLSKIDR